MDDGTARRRGNRWRAVTRGLGELLVTAGLVLLLFVVFPWVEPRLPFNQVTVD